jgi:hypothetical protein
MNYTESFNFIDDELFNEYVPTKETIELSRARIEEKIKAKP